MTVYSDTELIWESQECDECEGHGAVCDVCGYTTGDSAETTCERCRPDAPTERETT